MTWERDRANERVDLALGMHHLPLVNRAVKKTDGGLLTFDLKVQLGTGHDGESCPYCHQAVKRDYTLQADGMLRNSEGKELKPADVADEYVRNLNDFHARMELHARLHKVRIDRGPGTR